MSLSSVMLDSVGVSLNFELLPGREGREWVEEDWGGVPLGRRSGDSGWEGREGSREVDDLCKILEEEEGRGENDESARDDDQYYYYTTTSQWETEKTAMAPKNLGS